MSVNTPEIMPFTVFSTPAECLQACEATEEPMLAIVKIDNPGDSSADSTLEKLRRSPHVTLFLTMAEMIDSDGVLQQGLLRCRPDGVVFTSGGPTASAGPRADIQRLDAALRVAEAEAGLPDGSVAIIAEAGADPAFFLSPHPLTGASPRLRALVFDGENLGSGTLLSHGRAVAVLKARQARLPCFEKLPRDADSAAAIRHFRETAIADGFDGIIATSASQVATLRDL